MSKELLDLRTVTPATFEPHVETAFDTDAGTDEAAALTLASVTRFPERPGATRVDPFALLFVGPEVPSLSQGIHRLAHPKLGAMEIFLVPVGPHGDGLGYEAVFN